MADDTDPLARKLVPLVTDLEATLARAHDQLAGIQRILAGGNPVGDVIDYFSRNWQAQYGSAYTWNRKVDPATIKRLLRSLSVPDLKRRIIVYFATADLFYVKNQHPFSVFVSTINAHTPKAPPRGPGCTLHDPPCQRTQECIARRLAEGREAALLGDE